MDDIAFFESSKYKHRGGIWADASRHERSEDLYPTTSETQEEDRAPSSAPASDPSTPLAPDLDPNALQRSASAPVEAQISIDGGSEPLESVPLSRAATVSTSSTTSSTSTRRRTWFGGAARDDGSSSPGLPNTLELPEETPERGRSGVPESNVNRRSSSTPSAQPDSALLDSQDLSDGSGDAGEAKRPIPTRRASSHHSVSPSMQDAPSQDEPAAGTSSGSESLLSGFRAKSPAPSSSSAKNLPASPTSNFFQTLKTRDKQAISNSAKEAIRKWGVNWGSLKKENATSGDEAADGDTRRQENKVHKPRPSYAEVRAAVEQRRNGEGLLAPSDRPSEPVDIPGRGSRRTISMSSSTGPGSTSGYSVGNSSSASTSPRSDMLAPEPASRPRSTSPSLSTPGPRPRTTSHHSAAGSDVALNPPLEEEEQAPARPIYTQPPAPKAMTIPGIHASHRGEVMSMGYAPPPPPPEQKKAPAIQSVYRLWKTPGAQQASQSDLQLGEAGPSGLEPDADSAPSAEATTPTPTPAPHTPPAPRPVPPPLPPRAQSTNVVQTRHPPEGDTAASPASAALQSIASKDRSRRESLGSPGRPAPAELGDASAPARGPPSPPLAGTRDEAPPPKPKPPALPPRRAAAPA